MKLWSAHRAGILLFFVACLGLATLAWGQFATAPTYTAGTVGGACNNATQNFAWPDASGHVLQCVSSVWTSVSQPVTAAGSTGYVQYNNGGALAGSANLFWNNGSSELGIGTATPTNTLDVNGAMAVGTYAGTTAPSNGLIVSGQVGIGSTVPVANLDLGNGSLALGSGLGTTLTTLNGTINASVTTITVLSTASYPSSGAISILGSTEVITYTGKTSTTFTGCTRGAYGTTASSHTNGSQVFGMILQVQPSSVGGLYTSSLTVFNNQAMIIGTPQYPYAVGGGGIAIGSQVSIGTAAGNGGLVAIGYNAVATGNGTAIGSSVTASGGFSEAFGYNTTAAAAYEQVLGQYNKATGSENATTWVGTTANPVLVVGIGTAGASANALMVFENGQMLVNGGTTVAVPAGTASLNAMGVSNTSADAALNATNSSGRSLLYVRDDGNVGIGTTSPAYLLHVGSASASGIVAEFQNSSAACTYQPGASSMTESCSSDVRLKTDIEDSGDALAMLAGMRVREFTVKSTGERRTGVIAQEMLLTHPEMVHLGSDGFYKVEEPNLWMLVKAVQQLNAENDDLETANGDLIVAGHERLAAIMDLRARLDALEGRR